MIRRVVAALCALALAIGPAGAQYRPNGFSGARSGFQFISGPGGFPAPGAVVDYDFAKSRYVGPAISVSNATGGYVDDSAGNWTLVPANTARRSDKGLLVEGAQTNSIRNNSMQGAVLGQSQNAIQNNSMQGAAAGTPGSVPTNWSINSNSGVTRTIGTPFTANGINWLPISFTGTATATAQQQIGFEGPNTIAALAGQIWTSSVYIYEGSGTVAPDMQVDISERNSAGSFLVGNSGGTLPLNATPTRYLKTATLSNAGTAFILPRLLTNFVSGVTYSGTIYIGSPQLEQAPGAGPVTRTTGTAAAFASGTAPTNWSINGGSQGVVSQIVGSGTDQGIDYLDVRFTGTSASTSFPSMLPDTNTGISALTGQLWSHSVFMKQIAGTSPPWSVQMSEKTSGGASVVNGNNGSTDLTSSWQRITYNRTLSGGATVAALQPIIACTANSGQTYDFTIRIGWPQLEQWSTSITTAGGASSPIRTTGTAATRAADVVTAAAPTLPDGTGTLAVVYRSAALQVKTGFVAAITGGSGGTGVRYSVRSSTATPTTAVFENVIAGAGNPGLNIANGLPGDGTRHVASAAWSATEQGFAVDGAAPLTQSVSASGATTLLSVGSYTASGGTACFCYIERLAIYPYRAANSNLQQMSTLANWGG